MAARAICEVGGLATGSAAFSPRLNSLVQIPFYCFPSRNLELGISPASLRVTSGGAAAAMSEAAGSGLNMSSILSSVSAGVVGGATVMAIVGLIKPQMAKAN